MKPVTYASNGLQARAKITFLKPFAVGDWVQIMVYRYVFGTHFTGTSPTAMAESLTNAINGIGRSLHTVPNRVYTLHGLFYAVNLGTEIEVISTVPGKGGNAFAVTTNVATKVTVPANFSLGYDAALPLYAVQSPVIIDGIGGVASDAYNDINATLKDLFIQNLGVSTIKYAINSVASATNFHGIIPPGLAIDDGQGVMVNILYPATITQVSLFSVDNFRANVIKFI